MFVHQFVHVLNYGDAISGEAIAIKRLVEEQGMQCKIYCVHSHEKVREHASKMSEFETNFDSSSEKHCILLHYSIASPLNDLYAKIQGGLKALLYHNLTPVSWFLPYNTRVADDLKIGHKELPALLEISDIVLADSTYNKSELEKLGCNSCQVLPLPIDGEKWSVAENPGIAKILLGNGCKNFLHVGRLAPNKCIEDIIKTFYFYHHKIDSKSKLWLIGHDIDTEIYSLELRLLVESLRVENAVEFVGSVADSELKAFYQNSDCYLCMSEHEGFCVPVLEAMRFKLPVVAYASTALPETMGDAGFLVNEKNHAEIAELVSMIVAKPALKSEIVKRGLKRVDDFSENRFYESFKANLLDIVGSKKKKAAGSAS